MNGIGWTGPTSAVRNYLSVVGADRCEDGSFMLCGAAPTSFMGAGDELVVPAECCYLVNGTPVRLAANMPASVGIKVRVIG